VAADLRAAGCVFAEEEAALLIGATGSPAELERAVRRRREGTPLEVILGWAEFCGLRIGVDAGVFVPRRRTEFLVALAAERCASGAVIVDLCCGTGAIGLAVAHSVRSRAGAEIWVHAADLDPAAVRCAVRNLAAVGGRVYRGDLYRALPQRLRGRIDVLVVNAPYVPTERIASMPPEARDHEPRLALDGGPDGVEVQRRVIAGAPAWLAGEGVLLIETGADQAPRTAAVMREHGFAPRTCHDEELGGTVVLGRKALAE
jgi:release factor glutamine methyltransferase